MFRKHWTSREWVAMAALMGAVAIVTLFAMLFLLPQGLIKVYEIAVARTPDDAQAKRVLAFLVGEVDKPHDSWEVVHALDEGGSDASEWYLLRVPTSDIARPQEALLAASHDRLRQRLVKQSDKRSLPVATLRVPSWWRPEELPDGEAFTVTYVNIQGGHRGSDLHWVVFSPQTGVVYVYYWSP